MNLKTILRTILRFKLGFLLLPLNPFSVSGRFQTNKIFEMYYEVWVWANVFGQFQGLNLWKVLRLQKNNLFRFKPKQKVLFFILSFKPNDIFPGYFEV